MENSRQSVKPSGRVTSGRFSDDSVGSSAMNCDGMQASQGSG